MEHQWNEMAGETTEPGGNPPLHHFVHHKSHMRSPGIEPGSLWLQQVCQKSSTTLKSSKNIRQYVFSRYMLFVKTYERVLEKRFPTALHVYRIFMVGIKDFYRDMKTYFKLTKRFGASVDGLKSFNRKELEIYCSLPKDIMKVTPMLLLSALPFANYVVFPLVYLFPRQLLCPHFWTLQQRVEFAVIEQRKRLYNYKPVFRCLQAQLHNLEERREYQNWSKVLGLLGSGVHPTPEMIIATADLFRGDPYHLSYIYPGHVTGLLKMHGMHLGLRRRHRLAQRANILHEMDRAIAEEGGVHKLTQDELRMACFIRGLNPVTMKTDDILEWLNQWLAVSTAVDKSALSLLLHCPILLAYNMPTNWALIH